MDQHRNSTNVLVELSKSMADLVAGAQPSIVRVSGRPRYGATGIVWSADGLIITADHVVDRDEDITIGLADGRELAATLVGRDRATDLALLKVDAGDLTPASFSTDAARIGQLVLAIGNPHGDQAMASLGVVSAVGSTLRSWRGGSIEGVIRSDVTLYPGFSGGPLLGADGQVVGLNTSNLARGLAVAIPHAVLSRVVDALSSGRGTKRGYLGIATQPVRLPDGLRTALGLKQETGLLIVNVEAESPAEQAGLFLGDTLIAAGERETADINGLQDALGPGSAGSQLVAKVVRAGQRTDVTVTIGER
jgi:S1-C subfamily serine protease